MIEKFSKYERISQVLRIVNYVVRTFVEAWLWVSGTVIVIFFWALYSNKDVIVELCRMLLNEKGFHFFKGEVLKEYIILCLFYTVLLLGNAYLAKKKITKSSVNLRE